jgi:hypothetical protein
MNLHHVSAFLPTCGVLFHKCNTMFSSVRIPTRANPSKNALTVSVANTMSLLRNFLSIQRAFINYGATFLILKGISLKERLILLDEGGIKMCLMWVISFCD